MLKSDIDNLLRSLRCSYCLESLRFLYVKDALTVAPSHSKEYLIGIVKSDDKFTQIRYSGK